MIVYIIGLMILVLKNIKLYGREQFPEDFLTKTYAERLKGICAILIVLHHISQNGYYKLPFSLFNRIGCLIVAVFFFLSGYGMSKSYSKDIKAFSDKFMYRIWHLLFPYLVVLVITVIELKWNGNIVQFSTFLKGLRYGEVFGNWFFYSIIFLYCVFQIIFCRLPVKVGSLICVIVIWLTGCALWQADWNGWWYNSILAFAIGSIFAFSENEIIAYLKINCNYYMTVGLLVLLYIGFRVLNVRSSIDTIGFFLSESLAPTVFAVVVIFLNIKIRIMNSVWNFIGNISYEIFLLHALFIGFYRGKHIYVNSNVLFAFLVIGCSIIVGVLFKRCTDYIMSRTRYWFIREEGSFK